jgi:hypothetical protein
MKKLVDYFHNVLKAGGDRNKIKGRKLFYQYVNRLLPAVDFGGHFGVGGDGWDPNFWAHRVDDLAGMDAWDEESESEEDSDTDDEDGGDDKQEEEDEDKSPPHASAETAEVIYLFSLLLEPILHCAEGFVGVHLQRDGSPR